MFCRYIKIPRQLIPPAGLLIFSIIIVGMFVELGVVGDQIKEIVLWSPYGTVKRIIAAGMQPGTWIQETTTGLLVTFTYATVFSVIGIKKFKWSNK